MSSGTGRRYPLGRAGSRPVVLSEAMELLVRSLGAPRVSVLADWKEQWPKLVGVELAKRTTPVELVDRVLVVSCTEAVWASQLSWNEADIKRKFKTLFGEDLVDKLVIRRK